MVVAAMLMLLLRPAVSLRTAGAAGNSSRFIGKPLSFTLSLMMLWDGNSENGLKEKTDKRLRKNQRLKNAHHLRRLDA